MIIAAKPSISLITRDQIKLLSSFKIDSRMPWQEKIESFGLSVKYKDGNFGGYYDVDEKTIYINNKYMDYMPVIVSHELSHHIQNLTVENTYPKSIVHALKYEQQAESINQLILKNKLFPGKTKNYLSYFKKKDLEFLKNYLLKYSVEDDSEDITYEYNRRFY